MKLMVLDQWVMIFVQLFLRLGMIIKGIGMIVKMHSYIFFIKLSVMP